jgi:MoaA/NifB/PqqE/SkfB family radical SAM enzyme
MVFCKGHILKVMLSRCALVKKIIFSNFLRPGFPYKLTFAVTYKCNLKCKTCFIWKKEQKNELGLSEIEQFFKKSNLFSWIDLIGGEIFLREDLPEILEIIFRHCRQLRILHFPTNGYLTEKIINIVKKICQYRKNIILVITVSMDGPEKINNEIRGNENAWARSLDTFIGLKKLGLKFVYLGYTISKYNSGSLEDMLLAVRKYYPRIGYNDIHVNIPYISEHYLNNASMHFMPGDFSTEDIENFSKGKSAAIKNFLERQYFKLIPDYLSLKQMPLKCQALASTCFIDPYGDIYPCIVYNRKISNIRDIDYDLHKFWKEDRVNAVRKEILDKECQGCWTPCEAYPAIMGSILNLQVLG